jgi:hypothetical protein
LSGPPRTDGPNAGSAIILGGNKLLTCRHILPESAHGFQARIDNQPYDARPRKNILVAGNPVVYEVVAAGKETASLTEDWAVLQIVAGTASLDLELPDDLAVVFDPDPVLAPDDDILLIGYWAQGNAEAGPSIVQARVVDPALISVPEEIICVKTSANEVLEGMSGGAAVVWNADTRLAVIVGLYRGMRQLKGFGRVWAGAHTVRRLPKAAFSD